MSRENPFWGAPRILSELLLLGYAVAEETVANGPSSSHLARVFPVLPQFPASSVLGSQLANTPVHRTTIRERSRCPSTSRRFTSSIHTVCRLTVDPSFQFELPSWQADRPEVPKLRSRKIPGFFIAVFSDVIQFDLSPSGRYNRQIEFLGRTPRENEPCIVWTLCSAQGRPIVGRPPWH
jgi:hypothetical protein